MPLAPETEDVKRRRSFIEALSLRKTGENTFESVYAPLSGFRGIAYGGSTLAFAIRAAFETVSNNFHLYSMLGTYLGPALSDRTVRCTVSTVRQTRSFATRQVMVTQQLDGGKVRHCLLLIADFQAKEQVPPLLSFSKRPSLPWSPPHRSWTTKEASTTLLRRGDITDTDVRSFEEKLCILNQYVDRRVCPESVDAQTLSGMARHVKTTQDAASSPDKMSADWLRVKEFVDIQNDRIAAWVFALDGNLSYLGLVHDNKSIEDASVSSSLDFALRIFRNDIKPQEWHLRELKTVVAADGRAYAEAQLFDLSGKLVASMTQQCMVRGKSEPRPNI